METKKNWLILNIWLPLLPLFLRGFIKIIMAHLSLDIIDGSELWFVLALICLLIFQDLRLRDALLDNNDKKAERQDRATLFIILSLVCIFFCSANEVFYVLVDVGKNEQFNYSYYITTCLSYAALILIIKFSLQTRRQFNLTSKFL